MNIAIVGFDREGRASYDYFTARGDTVTVCDQKADTSTPEGVETQLGEEYLDNLDRFDVIVRTPGLHPQKILEKNPSVEAKITSGTNEFFKACPTKNIIGITGTKGKGTTSTLVSKMLEAAGKTVHLGGNIGIPVLGFVHDIQPDDWVVLELSSFQLMDLKYSPHIAACLMIANDHLNWHGTFQEYVDAKQNLFVQQDGEDIAIYYSENNESKAIVAAGAGIKIPYYMDPGAYVMDESIEIAGQTICRTNELSLLGSHNWQNVCAAITIVWQITQDVNMIRDTVTTFIGLPHRLEFVRKINEITFYNDSFASNPDATTAALTALPGNKVVIIGGFDRMLPLEELIKNLRDAKGDVRMAIFIGASSARLESVAQSLGFSQYVVFSSTDMLDVVHGAKNYAKQGDTVLFSPGFASFDMFKNFEDRGIQFKHAVEALA